MPKAKNGESTRVGYFDVARAFAIIAVIVGHTCPIDSFIHDFCFTFELPLFFLTSGYFIRPDKRLTSTFVIRSLKATMLPYLVTSLLLIGISAVRGVLLQSEQVAPNVMRWTLAALYGAGDNIQLWPASMFGGIGAIWFLPALFFVRIGLVSINGLKKEWAKTIAVLVVLVVGLASANFVWLPMSIQPAMVSLPFAYCGQLIRRSGFLDERKYPWIVWLCMALAFGALVVMGGHMYLNVARFTDGFLIDFAGGVIGTLCVLKFSQWLCNGVGGSIPVLEWVGRSTLAIFCMHLIDLNVGPLTIPIVFATVPPNWVLYLLMRFVTAAILCFVAWCIPVLRKVYYPQG